MYPEMVGLFTMIRNSQTQHKHHVRTTGYRSNYVPHGRRLRGGLGGHSPQTLRWEDCPCIRPPIFGEVTLRDERESTK